nr:ATP-binding protein [Bacteroidota bacterium]
MIKRKIEKVFHEWSDRVNRKPLIVRGARQVGKTWAIEEFAKIRFDNYLKINLEQQKDIKKLFEKGDTFEITRELSLFFQTELIPGKSLLFLDEIQACPKAIVSLRYFYEQQKDLHVIAAGSLLDHTLNSMKYPMPVGRIEFCHMYPVSFSEFLEAQGEQNILSYLDEYTFAGNFSELIHTKLIDYLRLYYFVGGMPEAVNEYIIGKDLKSVERIHSNIINSLKFDFAKYGTLSQQEHLLDVFNYVANNVGKRIKYVNISETTRSTELKTAFKKLELSRVIHNIDRTTAGGVPLSAFTKDDKYKSIFMDIGLANHIGNIQLVDLQKLVTFNEGALAEQFIGQELLTIPETYLDPQLFYWSREVKNSNAELDFLYQHQNKIFPIEVKAGKSGSLKSLHLFLAEKNLLTGIRFNTDLPSFGELTAKVRIGNIQQQLSYRLISLPLYMCSNLPLILNQYLEK